MTSPDILGPVRDPFRSVVRAVAPSSSTLDEAGWERAEAVVATALSQRPPSVGRQVRLFLRILDLAALPGYGKRLRKLEPDQARAFLKNFERSPILLLRRGFWGVRTLAYMGYYAQHAVQDEVGYAASRSGWASAGGGAGEWPTRAGGGSPEETTLTARDGAAHA